MDEKEDIFFFHSLFDYHMRREEALGYAMASDLLVSLRSSILTYSGASMVKTFGIIEKGTNLHEKALKNREKIERLAKKIRQSKSIKRKRTWYQIILRLYEEILQAELGMKELDNG